MLLIAALLLGGVAGYFIAPPWFDGKQEAARPTLAPSEAPGRTVVVWVSVDGVRPDYLERAPTPFLDRLMEEGAFSAELIPIFPSLTFPSHVSQATGVKVADHGIPLNSFFDQETGRFHSFPNDSSLLEAEPIWLTAQRQGIRTAVVDWPLSYAQFGEVRTDYHSESYDQSLSDRERIQRLADVYEVDMGEPPLRLLMGYIVGTDKAGHQYGPDADEMVPEMERVDQVLADFFAQFTRRFEGRMNPDDELIFIITTDHGMGPVEHLVNLEALAGITLPDEVELATGGNVAHLHFHRVDQEMRERMLTSLERRLEAVDFVEVYRREDMPDEWHYRHPSRVGDLVVVLAPGHTFSRRFPEGVFDPERAGGPLGMHGYSPELDADMLGVALFWSSKGRWSGLSLGPVDSLRLHATVAALLDVQPAEGAITQPVEALVID